MPYEGPKLQTNGVTARCKQCDGAVTNMVFTSDDWRSNSRGWVRKAINTKVVFHYRLSECAACGHGALAVINEIGGLPLLLSVFPSVEERVAVPPATRGDLRAEFDEAQGCADHGLYRAATAMLRSTLEKALKHAGYTDTLFKNIEKAVDERTLTPARKRRLHDNVRAAGNDVLHDEWRPVGAAEYVLARDYVRAVLDDLYEDREMVEEHLAEIPRAYTGAEPADEQPTELSTG